MSKLTEALGAAGVYNDYEFFNANGAVWITYHVAYPGSPFRSKAIVHRTGFRTDPDAHWSDNGCKVFYGEGRPGVSKKTDGIVAAQAWASERYGITEWARTPFGGYGDATFVRARLKTLKRQCT